MKVLVIGGTRFFGIPMINKLLQDGQEVTIATRSNHSDLFGSRVRYLQMDRCNPDTIQKALYRQHFDMIIDKIAYCSNDIRYLLDHASCEKYICMSSASVYDPLHIDTMESDYDPAQAKPVWGNRSDFSYNEGKRQMECAILQYLHLCDSAFIRYPFVIGPNDYTKRLAFYVEHVVNSIPMYIDHADSRLAFIQETEAGTFFAHLLLHPLSGAINGCSHGTVSIREILDYLEAKTGIKALLSQTGDPAPYNGAESYTLNTDKAESCGYHFSDLDTWIFSLLDHILEQYHV